jgi:hypothetical protein
VVAVLAPFPGCLIVAGGYFAIVGFNGGLLGWAFLTLVAGSVLGAVLWVPWLILLLLSRSLIKSVRSWRSASCSETMSAGKSC